MKAVLAQSPWMFDPLCVRKSWDEEAYQLGEHGHGKKLCFGLYWSDGVMRPHPPILRALAETKKALIAAGHIVVDWNPPSYLHGEICKNAVRWCTLSITWMI
jgi:amidase